MLILTRHVGETIILGENEEIAITILSNKGSRVRIGITAKKDIPIWRGELLLNNVLIRGSSKAKKAGC